MSDTDVSVNATPEPTSNAPVSDTLADTSNASPAFNSAPILSGQPAPVQPAQPADFADPSIVPNALGSAPATSPLGGPQAAPQIPQAAGTPSVWKNIAMGALFGAAAGAGSKNIGVGASRGVQAVQTYQQNQLENSQRKEQLQFESVRAADSHIAALNSARAADNENIEAQNRISDHADAAEELLEEKGIVPKVSIQGTSPADSHAQATGALKTLANQNGGTIPQVSTTNKPDGTSADGKTHTTNVFSVSIADTQNNPNGTLDIINKARAVKGQPPMTQSDLQIAGGQAVKGNWRAGAAQIANDSINFFTSIPKLSTGKSPNEISSENAATSAHLQQQLDSYSQSPNADPKVVATLKSQMDAFNKTAENQRGKASMGESNNTLEQAPSKAESARQEDLAKQDTPQGRATLQKTQQEIINAKYANAENHQKALFDQGVDPQTGEKLNLANAPDEALIDSNTHQPIPTKMLSTLKPSQQESNRADFANSALHSLDLIDQLKAQGKLPNGPINGWTTKGLIKSGLSNKDAAEAYGLIALTQSAATGAHVGGRFSAQIMDKMNGLLTLNANDSQFDGQVKALRDVMTPYAQHGGRQTVGEYKQEVIGSVQTLKNGQKVKVTGLDKNGNFIGTQVQ